LRNTARDRRNRTRKQKIRKRLRQQAKQQKKLTRVQGSSPISQSGV
jgi:hypothetical protein